MTDRELLELAAKAVHTPENYANISYMKGWYSRWNPLTNDSDALRLATNLKFDIQQRPTGIVASDYFGKLAGHVWEPINPENDLADKRLAATRRAIVRAAAEIGRSMK